MSTPSNDPTGEISRESQCDKCQSSGSYRVPAGVSVRPPYAEPVNVEDLEPGDLVVVRFGTGASQVALIQKTGRRMKGWKFRASSMRWTKHPITIMAGEVLGLYRPQHLQRTVDRIIALLPADAAHFWEAEGKAVTQ